MTLFRTKWVKKRKTVRGPWVDLSRRKFLWSVVAAAVGIGAGWHSAFALGRKSTTKLSKAVVHYVGHAVNGKECVNCRHFQPDSNHPRSAMGACIIVSGAISPRGYCVVWAPRNPGSGC